MHLYKKINQMEQIALEKAMATNDPQEALRFIYEARGIRGLKTYIDIATSNKLVDPGV